MSFKPVLLVGSLSLAAWAICVAAADAPPAAGPPAKSDAEPPAKSDAAPAKAEISTADREFFEKSIRPILVEKCYGCHSAEAKILQGGLRLDSRPGIAAGGESGAIITERDPDKSRLILGVRGTDANFQMPPDEKLSTAQIAALERWVKLGVPDPRDAAAAAAPAKKIDLEQGRKWWAFQPIKPLDVPATDGAAAGDSAWPKKKLDHFILAQLRANRLEPSPAADRATLLRRAYLDLTGLRPTFDQIAAFIKDDTDGAYEKVIDELLASPRYGERWGRYWLDVVRYGEDNFTGEATTPPFPFAWRYREWVIEAVNADVPYDRFVKLQLAADLMPGVPRKDLVALGFLGAAPGYHKDGRLSKDVVETLYGDDWDERLDTVTRGFLGLTVACARCHDHKFDPIPTTDYYALAGVFASTVQAPRPLAEIDPAAETRFMVDTQRIFYRSYAANLLRDDPGSKPAEARQKVIRLRDEMEKIRDENAGLRDKHPEMYNLLAQLAKRPSAYPDEPKTEAPKTEAPKPADPAVAGGARRGRGRRGGSAEPLFQAVYDAGFHIDGSDADFTFLEIRPGQPRDLNVLIGGNVTKPGPVAPRGFLSVLAVGDPKFQHGSGRRELAERIFADAAPLSARVIVNRVWAWHFGKPLVNTQSDFGVQGERPSHPELLDDLSARFVEAGYSLKWLHREIMLSAAYRQASTPRSDVARVDPGNRLLWRMNPRRLDIEAYRDCLLQAAGSLENRLGGPSQDLDQANNLRRTVYARITRGIPSTLLGLYDFPAASMHSPQRDTTISPLQQLFVMNSTFVQDRAAELARAVERETAATAKDDSDVAKVRGLYRRLLGREPTIREQAAAAQFLETAKLPQYAQALLVTNEVIFWP